MQNQKQMVNQNQEYNVHWGVTPMKVKKGRNRIKQVKPSDHKEILYLSKEKEGRRTI